MRGLLCIGFLGVFSLSFGQGHSDWVKRINTLEQARKYADKHKDVIVSFVNQEKDPFLFENVDTSKMEEHIGEINTLFGRSTKFLKDTVLTMVDIQVIQFNLKEVGRESVDVLKAQMIKKLQDGSTYWDLKKDYNHTSASFNSGPEMSDQVKKKYNVDLTIYGKDSIHEVKNGKNIEAIIILSIPAHSVPAFYAISYNSNL